LDGIINVPLQRSDGSDGTVDKTSVLQSYSQACTIFGKKLAYDLQHKEATYRSFIALYLVNPFMDQEDHLFDLCEVISKFMFYMDTLQNRSRILIQVRDIYFFFFFSFSYVIVVAYSFSRSYRPMYFVVGREPLYRNQ
jgi:hypothetical protein